MSKLQRGSPTRRILDPSAAQRIAVPRPAERGSVSRSTLAGRARYRRLKHACSRATCCVSQTRAPLSAVSRSEEYQDAPALPRRLTFPLAFWVVSLILPPC